MQIKKYDKKDKKVLDFELILDNNYYANLKSLHLCFQ